MVRVVKPSLASGETEWSVITPSMRTLVWPLTVTAMTTRTSGMEAPADTRNKVCSGDCTLILKTSSKPLVPVALLMTLTESNASRTSADTGIGTAGPIIKVRLTPVNMSSPSRNAGRQRDANERTWCRGDVVRRVGQVGVADEPVRQRVADK